MNICAKKSNWHFIIWILAGCLLAGMPIPLKAQNGPVPPALVSPQPVAPTTPTPIAPPDTGVITRYIRVTGYGVVRRRPDQATITFGVSSTQASALGALRANSDLVTRVVQALIKGGVPQDNIIPSESTVGTAATSNPSTPLGDVPMDSYDNNNQNITPSVHYTAYARVQVVTYTVSDTTTIVQLGMYGGATSVLSMRFEPHNMKELKQEALIDALKDAASKAEILSLGVKVRILYAISATELPTPEPKPDTGSTAPPAEIAVPMNIEVVYAIG